jgi:NAD(P)-dependent dehydrogenase (short-subunit alcohol dehydrogenase family)
MNTSVDFSGKVALVTGAGSGIGRASARAFARAGAAVAVVDVDEAGGRATIESLEDASRAQFFKCNVASEDEVAALVAAVTRTFGKLDFAHNNAGISPRTGPTAECSKELWDAIVGVNLTGVWLCMKHEIPAMLAAGGGAIVNTSSGAGIVGVANQPPYVAAKHGVVGLTKTAALEYATQNIRVNAVCPGTTMTGMVIGGIEAGKYTEEGMAALCPMRRIADPDEIAQAVVWLCSDAASFVNGAILPVDGGTVVGPVTFGR